MSELKAPGCRLFGVLAPETQSEKLLGTGGCPMESRRRRVLEWVKQDLDGEALQDIAEVWRSDHEVVLAAVQANGRALQFAAEALKGDRETVLAAVRQHGDALEHATDSLRADRE
eukprot:3880743-Amphidinium_carterae.1